MDHPALRPRRRWPIVLPTVIVVVLAVAWTGLWFYAASRAEQAVAGWRAREAAAGRVYSCGAESLGGYPFRIEVRCTGAGAELRSSQPALQLQAQDLVVAAQVYQPTLLIGELSGPLTITEAGATAPPIVGNWTLAQSSVRGTPRDPQRVSIVFDRARFARATAPRQILVEAHRIEVHGRMAGGSAAADPVIEMALRLGAASIPAVSPSAVQPIDAEIVGVLRGLKDFSGKPWSARFRELQERGGRLDITHARATQGDVAATAVGSLGVGRSGRVEGTLQLTIAGIDKLLPALGLDRAPPPGEPDKLAPAVDALNKLMPGLGNFAREHAGPTITAGLNIIGKPTTLDGKPAVIVPLRFADGAIYLGPLKIGKSPALY